MQIEVEGECFHVTRRFDHGGTQAYDFRWVNGPSDTPYGFTIGPSSPTNVEFSRALLEEEARLFVEAFFSDDGIGLSDFPDFVEARRQQRRHG